MNFNKEHELHAKRFDRNVGVALCLGAFILLLFGLTYVKIQRSGMVEGFDHQPRVTALPPVEGN